MAVGTAPFPFDSKTLTLKTPAGLIPYWILFPEGYGEEYTRGQGNSTTLSIACKWSDAATFIKYALGFTTGIAGTPAFSRNIPLPSEFGESQWLTQLREVSVGNFNATSSGDTGTTFELDPGFNYWPKAGYVVYSATFTTLNWNSLYDDTEAAAAGALRPDGLIELTRYLVVTERDVPKERKAPGYTFVVEDDPTIAVPENGFFPIYETELVYTWKEIPYTLRPRAEQLARLVKVNNATFDGYAAEQLLFKGVAGEQQPYVGPNGELYIDIPYVFGYRPFGWNTLPIGFLPGGGPNFRRVKQKGVGGAPRPPYASTDFGPLFKPRA